MRLLPELLDDASLVFDIALNCFLKESIVIIIPHIRLCRGSCEGDEQRTWLHWSGHRIMKIAFR